jgi:hypothetical protein
MMMSINILLLVCALIMGLILFFSPYNTHGWNPTLGIITKSFIKIISLFSAVSSMMFLIKMIWGV